MGDLMAGGLSPEEWAARNGHRVIAFGAGSFEYADPQRRVGPTGCRDPSRARGRPRDLPAPFPHPDELRRVLDLEATDPADF